MHASNVLYYVSLWCFCVAARCDGDCRVIIVALSPRMILSPVVCRAALRCAAVEVKHSESCAVLHCSAELKFQERGWGYSDEGDRVRAKILDAKGKQLCTLSGLWYVVRSTRCDARVFVQAQVGLRCAA